MQKETEQSTQSNVHLHQRLPLSWREGIIEGEQHLDAIMYDNEALLINQHWLDEFEHTLHTEFPRANHEDVVLSRLNLVLSLFGIWMRRQFSPPPVSMVTLDEYELCWETANAPPRDAEVVIQLYLIPRFPMPLTLPAKIVDITRGGESGSKRVRASLHNLSEVTRQGIARAVFRYHRKMLRERNRLSDGQGLQNNPD